MKFSDTPAANKALNRTPSAPVSFNVRRLSEFVATMADSVSVDMATEIEKALMGVIGLIFISGRIAFDYYFRWRKFDDNFAISLSTTLRRSAFVLPLTFVVLATIAYAFQTFVWLHSSSVAVQTLASNNLLDRHIANQLSTLDFDILLVVIFPIILMVASYSGISYLVARIFRVLSEYQRHLSAAAYTFGSFALGAVVLFFLNPELFTPVPPPAAKLLFGLAALYFLFATPIRYCVSLAIALNVQKRLAALIMVLSISIWASGFYGLAWYIQGPLDYRITTKVRPILDTEEPVEAAPNNSVESDT